MADPVFTGINHICIATEDLDRAVRVWSDKYAVGPWRLYTYDTSNMQVSLGGEPTEFGMRVGLCQFGPTTRVEIIQPLDDRSPYAESLVEHGGADHLHHIRVDVADYDGALAHLQGLGVPEVLSGRYQSADPAVHSRATYVDTTPDLGFTMEVAHLPTGLQMPEPDYIYPAPDSG
jgi:methylmalonyl-CoA/ethylmalonyl-CoA epimerase